MAEKRSICKCSSTPEANYFTSKGQSHVHCPCEKCEDRAVYPIFAWRHMQKRVRYSDVNADDAEVDIATTPITTSSETTPSSDCFSVSHYYAEFDNFSPTPCLLAAGGTRDDDKTAESEVSDTDSSRSGDVFGELVSSEGSENGSDALSHGVEEETNGMRDFIREAVLKLVEIKGNVGFSINTFEDLLKWGANLHCENNEAAQGHWPLSW